MRPIIDWSTALLSVTLHRSVVSGQRGCDFFKHFLGRHRVWPRAAPPPKAAPFGGARPRLPECAGTATPFARAATAGLPLALSESHLCSAGNGRRLLRCCSWGQHSRGRGRRSRSHREHLTTAFGLSSWRPSSSAPRVTARADDIFASRCKNLLVLHEKSPVLDTARSASCTKKGKV